MLAIPCLVGCDGVPMFVPLRRLRPFIVVALGVGASVHCRTREPTPPVDAEPESEPAPAALARVEGWAEVSERFGERRYLSTGTVAFYPGPMALVRPPQARAQLWDLRTVPPYGSELVAGPNPDDAECEALQAVDPTGTMAIGSGVLCTIEEPEPDTGGVHSMRAIMKAEGRLAFWRFGPDDVRVIESSYDRKTWALRQRWPESEGPLADGVTWDVDGVTIGRDSATGVLLCDSGGCKEAPLLDAIEGRWQPRPAGLLDHRIQRYWWLDDTLMLVDNAMDPPRVLRMNAESDEAPVEELCRLGPEPSWEVATWSEGSVHRIVTLSTMDSPVVWRLETEGGCVLERTLPAEGQWFRSAAYVHDVPTLGDVLWLGAHAPSGEDTAMVRAVPMNTAQVQVGNADGGAPVVDWTPAPLERLGRSGPASEDAWPRLTGTASFNPDESFQLDIDLANAGNADARWTRVRVTSTPADALPGGFFEVPVGRLEPGQRREISVELPVRHEWREHEVGFVVRWTDAHERSTGGTQFSWWPQLLLDADDEDRLAQSIVDAGARVLDQVTGTPQKVRPFSLDPHEYGFYTSYGGRVHYQRMFDMEPTPLAVNREVWQASSRDELQRLVAPMQWWLLPHELGHTRVRWGGWDEEFLAAWVGVLLTRRLLGDDPEAPIRQDSMVRFYEQVVRRLDPQIDPALAERVRSFLAARGKEEPPGGLFLRFTPSTVLRDDPASYVWFLGRVSLWALEQPETLEDLLGPATAKD